MISLNTYRIKDNIPFQMYLLTDSRVKKMLREFDFYGIRFYREEKVKEPTVCFDYPKGNVYWYVDFKKLIESEILDRDTRYEKDWKCFLAKLKKSIKEEFTDLKKDLEDITQCDVVTAMSQFHLRDYQAYDLLQLMRKMLETPEQPSGLILSEQRTGKTRVALAAVNLMLNEGSSTIIVAPKTACIGWANEAEQLNHLYKEERYHVKMIKHTRELSDSSDFLPNAFNIRIISYELFKRFTYAQLRKLFYTEFSNQVMFIGDEIHRLRNFKTLQSEAIFRFKEGCLKDKLHLHILGVTGTPTVKDTVDIFGLFSLINHSKIGFQPYYKDFNQFKEYFYNCEDTSYGKICKTLKRTDELKWLIQVSAVQTKQRDLDIFANYEKKYLKYTLPMDEKQSEIYTSVEDTMEYGEDIDCINSLVQLVRLQQICIDPSGLVASYDLLAPKIRWAVEFIVKTAAKGIVMAKKLEPLKHLQAELNSRGIKCVAINGSHGMSARKDALDTFRTDSEVRVILIQLDAGRESLTLPQAKYTLFLDRDYAQGFNEQAEARMTPIDGKPVTKYVIDLVMSGTVEENIYDTLVIKKHSIETINTVFKKSTRKEDEE